MSFNPIRQSRPGSNKRWSFWKSKPKQAKVSMPWRAQKIRLDAAGMKQLRQQVFSRAEFQCENSIEGKRCKSRIGWNTFHLAHIISRGRGGSDVPENVLAACWECHDEDTANRRKLEPHKDWIAA